MAVNVSDMVNVLKGENVKVNILVINGSPRAKSNSQIPMDRAIAEIKSIPGANVDTFHFYGKKLEFCRHCLNYCNQHLTCMYKDDFEEFKQKWLWADGIVWVCPVYHMGPPAKVRAVLDRLSEVEFHTVHKRNLDEACGYVYPKFSKAVGAIVHGATRYGGQEITIQYFVNHSVLLDCFPVSGDMPECYLGAAGHSPNPETVAADESFLKSAASVGRRVTETAKIFKAGLMLSQGSLPDNFFPSKETIGAMDRAGFLERVQSE